MPDGLYSLETDGSVLGGERHESHDWPSTGGAGIVLWDPSMQAIPVEWNHLGVVSGSTEAEFRAALIGLRRANERRIARLRLRLDCQPVLQHLSGERILAKKWTAAAEHELRDLLATFQSVELRWTPSTHAPERRAGVPTADALARKAVGLGTRAGRRPGRRGLCNLDRIGTTPRAVWGGSTNSKVFALGAPRRQGELRT